MSYIHYFYLFSGTSNLIILQATYLNFEYVDISIQVINAKFENVREKDNGYNGCTKMLGRRTTGIPGAQKC